MLTTVSVTELQKSPSKIFKNTKAFKHVLVNNKSIGLILSREAAEFLENSGMLQEIEDYLLASNENFNEARKESREIIKNGDYSRCLNFDQLCEL